MKQLLNVLLLMLFLAPCAVAAEAVATYRASHGPVEATLVLNAGKLGELSITYDGHLFHCGCSSYSCEGNAVNAVITAKLNHTVAAHTLPMQPRCRQPYGPSYDEHHAFLKVGQLYSSTALWWSFKDIEVWRDTIGDLAHYYPGPTAPTELREIEIAFEAKGRWDSDLSRNYRLRLVRVTSDDARP